ncbi:Domain of unknown function DUF148 domain-containing protein [Strongyloides ratti]|uniref:DUF148 domain-containing protein n=1 Tax=Strongyloides ratti TaxID=34506 RepID=A0A090LH60_STRRB|nr:Domain of unknown function DUF148 domain-containing protein [Strongyloides ratti]CEF69117.1 Domain of unknown function DUF148 domain-containing protein [Strongyloides ratti]
MKTILYFISICIICVVFAQENIGEYDGVNLSDSIPFFLINATDEAKSEYKNIITNKSLSVNSIKQKIDELITNQSDEVKQVYEEAKAKAAVIETELRANLTGTMDSLTENSKPYFQELLNVIENQDIPLSQIPQKLSEIAAKITDESVKNEIGQFFPINMVNQQPPSDNV